MAEFKRAPAQNRSRTLRLGGLDISVSISGEPITNIGAVVQDQYRQIAQQAVDKYAPEETGRIVNVDGSPRTPISKAQLGGKGVVAGYGVDTAALQRAYDAALSHLRTAIAGFKNPTGAYANALTTLQNGNRVGRPDFARLTPESNLQITVVVAHASPLETILAGRLLLGAANAARKVGGVEVRFFYASGSNLGVGEGRGTYPVVEIGGPLSNVGNRPDSVPGAKAGRRRRRLERDREIVRRGLGG